MKAEKDYEELLKLFNKNKVRYCIVGAYALAFHAKPRFTQDMDILVDPDEKNAEKIIRSLKEFGFSSLKLKGKDLTGRNKIIQLGYAPLRVDLLTSVDGCGFEEVWKNRARGKYGKEKAYFMGIRELIKNKKATGRKQDEADIEILRGLKK